MGAVVLSQGGLGGAVGGGLRAEVMSKDEQTIREARVEQEVLRRKGEILRYQVRLLEEEQARWGFSNIPEREAVWQRTRDELMTLIQDEQKAEEHIRAALFEIWDAQERAIGWSARTTTGRADITIDLSWPVEPTEDISAHFLDAAYEQHFGIPHRAIDIPVLQGTLVRAAADGVVRDVANRGKGFNSITIVHDDSVVTLYGHVSAFLIKEGDHVRRGDPIARSGGEPGTPGAGLLSTGQHLHFELMINGQNIDPLKHLPERE